jgi:hypothetical protein
MQAKAAPQENDTGVFKLFTPRNHDFPYLKVYRPLGNVGSYISRPEFRVLHILPGAVQAPLKCKLVHCKLRSSIAYDALSYCAGDPNDTRQIILNGYPFKTFRSTHEALLRFRSAVEVVVMWIDQICINQTDIAERDSQVLLMRDRYKCASHTHVWLGPAATEPPNKLAFDLIHEFVHKHRSRLREAIWAFGISQPGFEEYIQNRRTFRQKHGRALDEWYSTLTSKDREKHILQIRQCSSLQIFAKWSDDLRSSPDFARQLDALSNLFQRDWWSRCWIVQEVVVSDVVVLHCGTDSMHWEDLLLLTTAWDVCKSVWSSFAADNEQLGDLVVRWYKKLSRIQFLRVREYRLDGYLAYSRDSLASDARDKVYSMLGMLGDTQRKEYAITPSYTSSNTISDVFCTAARAILNRDHSTELLEDITGNELETGLPSWVPDWSMPHVRPERWIGNLAAGLRHAAHLDVMEDETTLRLHGYIVDCIESLGSMDCGTESIDKFGAWQALFLAKAHYDHRLEALDSFYRSLRFDTWVGQLADPKGDAQQFTEFWRLPIEILARFRNRTSIGWRFLVSRNGRPGMALECAREGDAIFIPWGARTAYAIRSIDERPGHYHLKGLCYLHGMMHGEVFDLEEEGKVKSEEIYFV